MFFLLPASERFGDIHGPYSNAPLLYDRTCPLLSAPAASTFPSSTLPPRQMDQALYFLKYKSSCFAHRPQILPQPSTFHQNPSPARLQNTPPISALFGVLYSSWCILIRVSQGIRSLVLSALGTRLMFPTSAPEHHTKKALPNRTTPVYNPQRYRGEKGIKYTL